MHDSVMAFGRTAFATIDIKGKRVLEVGSMNVNGSLRGHVEAVGPSCYIGIDFIAGNGVDVVWDARDLVKLFGVDSFDVVISTEMLEHAEDWRGSVVSMKRVLKPDGVILLTARGPGFQLHGYPHDWHRFTVSDINRAFSDFKISVLKPDPQFPGVILLARKPSSWIEADLSGIHVAPADEVNAPR